MSGNASTDVVDDHLVYLDCFLEADGGWEDGADGFLRLWSRLQEDFGGGGGNSNELDGIVGGKLDLRNQCLGEHSVEVVS